MVEREISERLMVMYSRARKRLLLLRASELVVFN
jgi:hypothetical protein